MTRSIVPCHAPQGTVARQVVQAFFESWLADRRRTGRPVPKYVVDELRDFITCGDPEHGFITLACPTGHHTRFIADRCKGRGFCPYCLTLRQREVGHRLIERVLGNVPVRHVVSCLPPHLRRIIGYDAALLAAGFHAVATAVAEYQRRKAAELFGVDEEHVHPGIVEVNHGVSANLTANTHFHGILPDGVFIEVEPGRVEFRRLPIPTADDIAGIAHAVCVATCKALEARGFWEMTSMSSEMVEGKLTMPRRRPRRIKFFGEAAADSEGGVESRDGAYAFHVFVGHAIEVEDRAQLEHLVNYILAPPFKDGQLTWDGKKVMLRLKRTRHDGTEYVTFTPFEFLDRLADLVPRRNVNGLRYFGVYAPRARLRKLAVALHVDGTRPDRRCQARVMLCPLCSRQLRVVARVRPRGQTTGSIPPDTPETVIPRGKDRIGTTTPDDGQGRLFG